MKSEGNPIIETHSKRIAIGMQALSDDYGLRQIPWTARIDITTERTDTQALNHQQKIQAMITQNPITGRARKKLGNVYARTLYGKNVLQTCPPPRKGKETIQQKKAMSIFAQVSQMSNQVSASLLNQIYYSAPIGRNRRQQFNKDLSTGEIKVDGEWTFSPEQIQRIGSNPIVTTEGKSFTLASTQLVIPISEISVTQSAIVNETPLILLICPQKNCCLSMLQYTELQQDIIRLTNIPSYLMNQDVFLMFLWKANVGTEANPILTFGRYERI